MSTPNRLQWFTSTYTANNGACVECARLPNAMAIRDTKDRSGPSLEVTASNWMGMVHAVRRGELAS